MKSLKSSFKPQTKKEQTVFWSFWSIGLGFDLGGVVFHEPFLTGVGIGALLVSVVAVPLLRRKYRTRG
jgi:hypothetical protein